MTSAVKRGAAAGFVAWGGYGLVESLLVWLLPASSQASFRFASWDWLAGVGLLAAYPLAGILIGALAGVLAPKKAEAAPVVALALALALNLSLRPNNGLFAYAIVGVALACGAAAAAGSARAAFAAHPWTLVLAFGGASWVVLRTLDDASKLWKAAALAAVLAVSAGLGFLFKRISREATLAVTAAKLVVVALAGLLLVQRPADIASVVKPVVDDVSPDRPPVVLIILDTVSAKHLSTYGYSRDTSPNLTRFAADAVTYSRAVAPGDMTLATHASMWTGLYPRKHGAHFDERGTGRPLRGSFQTLAELLSARGYVTIGIAANHVFFGNGYGLEQGFDHFDLAESDEYVLYHRLGYVGRYYLRSALQRAWKSTATREQLERHFMRAEDVNARVFTALEAAERRAEPYFLFVNYMDAHQPYVAPAPWSDFAPGRDPAIDDDRVNGIVKEVVREQKRPITPAERAHFESQYDGAVAYLDMNLGKLFDRMKSSGAYEKSMIVVTADHGEAFGDRDLIGHGLSVYQDQVFVPLAIKYPGTSTAGARRSHELVSLVDLLPTIAEVAECELPEEFDGVSLRGPPGNRADRVLIAESHPNVSFLGERFQRIEHALFFGDLKLIASTAGKKELYDLAADPGETKNLYENPGLAADLLKRLEEWLDAVPPAAVEAEDLDPEAVERLKALDYM